MFFSGVFEDGFLRFPWGGEKTHRKWRSGKHGSIESSGESFPGLLVSKKFADSGTKGLP